MLRMASSAAAVRKVISATGRSPAASARPRFAASAAFSIFTTGTTPYSPSLFSVSCISCPPFRVVLTGYAGFPPVRTAATFRAALVFSSGTDSSLYHPAWSDSTTFSSFRSGLSAASGSVSNTSSPAAAMRLAARAAASAFSSTTGPREVLTRIAVGFSSPSCGAPIMPRVSGPSGTCTLT